MEEDTIESIGTEYPSVELSSARVIFSAHKRAPKECRMDYHEGVIDIFNKNGSDRYPIFHEDLHNSHFKLIPITNEARYSGFIIKRGEDWAGFRFHHNRDAGRELLSDIKKYLPQSIDFKKFYNLKSRLFKDEDMKFYWARRRSDNLVVYIKEWRRYEDNDKKFLEEINILRCLSARGLVSPFIEAFETQSHFLIITKYRKGILLNEELAKRGTFNEKESMSIMYQLLKQVREIHALKIVHRAISPQNLLVIPKHDGIRAEIINFSHARRIVHTHLIKQSTMRVKNEYRAPEINQKQPYDYKADIFSLGCLAFELLIGRSLFGSSVSENGSPANKEANNIELLDFKWLKLSSNALNFIKKTVTADPRQRPEVHEALQDKWFTSTFARSFSPVNRQLEVLHELHTAREQLKHFPDRVHINLPSDNVSNCSSLDVSTCSIEDDVGDYQDECRCEEDHKVPEFKTMGSNNFDRLTDSRQNSSEGCIPKQSDIFLGVKEPPRRLISWRKCHGDTSQPTMLDFSSMNDYQNDDDDEGTPTASFSACITSEARSKAKRGKTTHL